LSYEGKKEECVVEIVTGWLTVLQAIWRKWNTMWSWPIYWIQLAFL